MLKSENIVIRVSNQKPETMDKISNFVHYLCWSNELEALSSTFSKMRSLIECTFPTENVDEINDLSKLILVDGLDVQKFIDTRDQLKSVKAILANLEFPSPIGELHFSIPSPQPHVLSGTNRGIAGEK